MHSINIFRAFGFWALIAGIVATLAQSDGASITASCSTTTQTSKTHTPPWDNPTHSPSTFTTIYLTYSPDPTSSTTGVAATNAIDMTALARRTAFQSDVVASGRRGDGGFLHDIATTPYGEVFHEDPQATTLTSFTTNGTLTLTMSETSTTLVTVYSGAIIAETMITLDSTPAATKGVNATVTDAPEVTSGYTTVESTQSLSSDGSSGNSTMTSPASASTMASLTSDSSMTMDSTTTADTTTTMPPSTTVVSHTIPTPPYGLTPVSIFDDPTATATSLGGASPTAAVKETLAVLAGLAGAAILVL